jgi:HAD superfamily hydrolase (TIGR01509 family)
MPNALIPDPAAVVLDFDGVILDSETSEFEAYRRVFARYGAPLTEAEWTGQVGVWAEGQSRHWHRRLLGLSTRAPALDAFDAERRRLFLELLPADPMPGIPALLDVLDREGVPVAIASTSPARWVMEAAARLGIVPRIRTIVTADDVVNRKPAPDVYLEATRRLQVAPARSVAVEDSGPGLAAALDAGLRTVAIPHRLTSQHDFSRAHLRLASATQLTLDVLRALTASG